MHLDLVILDELRYLPFSQSGGARLFHLLSKLYEHTSVIVATNLVFAEWDCSTTARGGGVCAAPGATDVRRKRETETDQLRNIDIGRESGSHNRPQERTTLYPIFADDSTSPRHQRGNNRSSSTL